MDPVVSAAPAFIIGNEYFVISRGKEIIRGIWKLCRTDRLSNEVYAPWAYSVPLLLAYYTLKLKQNTTDAQPLPWECRGDKCGLPLKRLTSAAIFQSHFTSGLLVFVVAPLTSCAAWLLLGPLWMDSLVGLCSRTVPRFHTMEGSEFSSSSGSLCIRKKIILLQISVTIMATGGDIKHP